MNSLFMCLCYISLEGDIYSVASPCIWFRSAVAQVIPVQKHALSLHCRLMEYIILFYSILGLPQMQHQ